MAIKVDLFCIREKLKLVIDRDKKISGDWDSSELSGRSLSESYLVHHREILSKKARKAFKIVSWNIRGLGIEVKCNAIRKIIREARVEMFLVQETKK
ncbi:hypothetical protein GQ457_12G017250 [Hibiscus cannabinus]